MKLHVQDDVVDLFPELRIHAVLASGIDNHGGDAALDSAKARAAERVAADIDDILAAPEIVAWREAYRAFGVKPKNHRPTAESFLRRVARTGEFPTISKAVDAYLLTETEHRLPVGGYDLDRIEGDVVLRVSAGHESFVAIGGDEAEATAAGEVVYSDGARILTRRWNYRDCDHAKITEDTESLALFVEAPFGSVGDDSLEAASSAISATLVEYCGGSTSVVRLDVSQDRSLTLSWPGA